MLGTINLGWWYPINVEFKLVGYSDADFAVSLLDRKYSWNLSISWFSKKQNFVALSTTAKYIAVASCCSQILWMKQTICDFD